MTTCFFCKTELGLLEERCIVRWQKRKFEKSIKIGYTCSKCSDSNNTHFRQKEDPRK